MSGIGVIFFIWVFLFTNYRLDLDLNRDTRRTWVWELLHFPLHFALVLLLASIVNAIKLSSWTQSLVNAYTLFVNSALSLLEGSPLSDSELWDAAMQLDKLDLAPDFTEQYRLMEEYFFTSNASITVRDSTILLESYQYIGQIVWSTCSVSSLRRRWPDLLEIFRRDE